MKPLLMTLMVLGAFVAQAQGVKVGRASRTLVLPNRNPNEVHKETEYLDSEGERLPSAEGAYHRREVSYRDAKSGSIKEFYPSGKLMDFSL